MKQDAPTNKKLEKDMDACISAKEALLQLINENYNKEHCANNPSPRKSDMELGKRRPFAELFSSVSKEDENTAATKSADKKSIEGISGIELEKKNGEAVGKILKSMPADFFDFWKFCTTLNKKNPEEAFEEVGFHLVGVYDLLSKNLAESKVVCINCHWRYYYDPPEFQTVVKLDSNDLFHIGYFRDDPSELPDILASNSANLGSKLTPMGDNIFTAMDIALTNRLSKIKNKKLQKRFLDIQCNLQEYAKKKKYSLQVETKKTKARGKKVVAKTFHNLGIVVPVIDEVGYRPLMVTDAELKKILNSIVTIKDEKKKLEKEILLEDVVRNIHYANDECDFGSGLHLSINLFCHGDPFFHPKVINFLPLAYSLLKREKYGEIVKAHLNNRKIGDNLNDL